MFRYQLAKTLFTFPKNAVEILIINFTVILPPPDLTTQVSKVCVEASPLQPHISLQLCIGPFLSDVTSEGFASNP